MFSCSEGVDVGGLKLERRLLDMIFLFLRRQTTIKVFWHHIPIDNLHRRESKSLHEWTQSARRLYIFQVLTRSQGNAQHITKNRINAGGPSMSDTIK